jgi:hypothetical protein
MCVRKKKQVDLLIPIPPFHIDYILRLFLFLTMAAQQQIFYRCIRPLFITIAKEYLCRQNKISGCAFGMSLDIKSTLSFPLTSVLRKRIGLLIVQTHVKDFIAYINIQKLG